MTRGTQEDHKLQVPRLLEGKGRKKIFYVKYFGISLIFLQKGLQSL